MKDPRPIKSIGRKRRAVGWTMLLLGVLVTAVWVASAVVTPKIGSRTVKAAAHRGFLYAFVSNRSYYSPSLYGGRHVLLSDDVWDRLDQDPPGLDLLHGNPAISARVEAVSFGALLPWFVRGSIVLPLWAAWAACFGAGATCIWAAKRAQRLARQGHCAYCGYNLAGLAADAPCPECGKSPV